MNRKSVLSKWFGIPKYTKLEGFKILFLPSSLNKGLFKLVEGKVGFRNPKQQVAGPRSQEVFSYSYVSLNQVSPHTSCYTFLFFSGIICLVSSNFTFHAVGDIFFHCVQVRCLADSPHLIKCSNNITLRILHFCVSRIISKNKKHN